MSTPQPSEHRERDATSLLVIGTFFAVFSLLVLLGTFWEERSHAAVVNVVSGIILLLVGAGMIAGGVYLRRRPR